MVCVCVFQKRRLAAGLTQTSQAAAGMGYNHQVSAAVVKKLSPPACTAASEQSDGPRAAAACEAQERQAGR